MSKGRGQKRILDHFAVYQGDNGSLMTLRAIRDFPEIDGVINGRLLRIFSKIAKDYPVVSKRMRHKCGAMMNKMKSLPHSKRGKLCNAPPVLALPMDPDGTYGQSVSVCVQKQLKKHEENYTTLDLELGAVECSLTLKLKDIIFMDKSVIYTRPQEFSQLAFLTRKERFWNMRQQALDRLLSGPLEILDFGSTGRSSEDLKVQLNANED
ncbi:hypothetical protein Tco_0033101 [Tanacetum coccineum]